VEEKKEVVMEANPSVAFPPPPPPAPAAAAAASPPAASTIGAQGVSRTGNSEEEGGREGGRQRRMLFMRLSKAERREGERAAARKAWRMERMRGGDRSRR